MNRVVFSSNRNLTYAFFTPIVSLLWRRRGWTPVVFLVGTAAEWLDDVRFRLVLERTRETGAEIYFVPERAGIRSSTIAQVVRIFGALAPGTKDDDFVLTSDVDMFPLGDWVGGGRDESKDLHLFYANAYDQTEYVHFPICYVGAPVRTWREIVGVGTVEERLGAALAQAPSDATSAWNFDERFLGGLIAAWNQPERTQEIPRTFVEGEWRIDRGGWNETMVEVEKRGSLEGVADAHILRPGHEANWPRIRRVLELALKASDLAWVDIYHTKWMEIL